MSNQWECVSTKITSIIKECLSRNRRIIIVFQDGLLKTKLINGKHNVFQIYNCKYYIAVGLHIKENTVCFLCLVTYLRSFLYQNLTVFTLYISPRSRRSHASVMSRLTSVCAQRPITWLKSPSIAKDASFSRYVLLLSTVVMLIWSGQNALTIYNLNTRTVKQNRKDRSNKMNMNFKKFT